ncbi:hypothetical protein SMGD1_1103 [Sulfurimonas gotlandica GD1]|uniref:Uncharacterized protein n=1 Tax=Sulfurimonas gotlandica (strain DSM 19862 / JCM 16533 / GD1) TaxID=929558 RepID=B6BGK0_SULGG|nr:hypothetical protein [Sulfurimonas gotlandica]EDZ63497.1 hypothetical protein CBGD1_1117 [Sulfurimonas gotlandica GD1]EHP29627.1 hypothetical protein SMGD1_1103 [Sulfurimonas gotlandica GD1]
MSKLINLHQKNDPLKDWEEKNIRNKKKSNIAFTQNKQEAHAIYIPKVYDSPQEIARIAEILATKEEIQRSLSSKIIYTNTQESAEINQRRKELLNIKKILQM